MSKQSSWFERAISTIAPSYALKREQAKLHLDHLRKYDAAAKGRRTSSWATTGTSANNEIYAASSLLRDRSRELCRNNPLVKRAVQSISNNTVGKGIKAKISTSNKKSLAKVESAWKQWFESSECDFNDIQTGYGIQKMVMRAVIESGDALIVKRRNNSKSIPIELQVLEIDFLDISRNSSVNTDGSFTFMGIEFNSKGKRTHYWLYDKHPGDAMNLTGLTSKRVSANDVIHVFEQLRPGQMLGVPFGVSAFLRARDMDEYNDAQVMRQKIAACYAVFINDNGAGSVPSDTEREEMERVEPGMMYRMGEGDSVSFANPPTTENYAEFNKTVLQQVAAGFGTTYENLTGDLSQVNFSSGRMGWIEHHRNIEDWQQNIIIPQLLSKVFNWFKEGLVLKGIVPASQSISAGWTPPRREMIDPSKEVKGVQAQIRNFLLSPQDAIRQAGEDPDEVLEETIAWNAKLDNANLISDADPRQGKGESPDGRGRPSTTGENTDDDVDEK